MAKVQKLFKILTLIKIQINNSFKICFIMKVSYTYLFFIFLNESELKRGGNGKNTQTFKIFNTSVKLKVVPNFFLKVSYPYLFSLFCEWKITFSVYGGNGKGIQTF